MKQRAEIRKQIFPIGVGHISFKILSYNAEKQEFYVFITIAEKKFKLQAVTILPIPKSKAIQYGKHSDLLVPDVNLRLNEKAQFIPDKFSFTGPKKDDYVSKATLMVNGNPLHMKDRFIVFDNQTILDTTTLLLWQQAGSNNQFSLSSYISQLNQQSFAGYSDWRIPSFEELKTILENKRMKGDYRINPVFDIMAGYYWSSTLVASNPVYAWGVNFFDGFSRELDKSGYYFVRGVRSGQ